MQLTDEHYDLIHRLSERVSAELSAVIPDWPRYGCWDACLKLQPLLRKSFAHLPISFEIAGGAFMNDRIDSAHYWIVASDGTIIDPTAGQFIGTPDLRIFKHNPAYVRADYDLTQYG